MRFSTLAVANILVSLIVKKKAHSSSAREPNIASRYGRPGMILQCMSAGQGNISKQQCSGLSNDRYLGFTADCVEQGSQVSIPSTNYPLTANN